MKVQRPFHRVPALWCHGMTMLKQRDGSYLVSALLTPSGPCTSADRGAALLAKNDRQTYLKAAKIT